MNVGQCIGGIIGNMYNCWNTLELYTKYLDLGIDPFLYKQPVFKYFRWYDLIPI